MTLALANGMLLALVLVELFITAFYKKEKVEWRDVVFNLNSGHILMWVLRGLEVGAFHLVLNRYSLGLLEHWSYGMQWVFGFIAWDFCFYWLHRLHHKYKLLWAVHVVHHEGEHFNLSLGIRNSWYSSLTSFPFFAGLAIIGLPIEIFIATSSIHYFIQFYNHNGLVNKSGWLEKIMITPSHHRVHHGKNDEYIDKNFGGTLVVWDKLFGTFQSEREDIPVQFGTKDGIHSEDIVVANNRPFVQLFKLKHFRFKQSATRYRVPDLLIFGIGLLLFGLLLYYIFHEEVWSSRSKALFFTLVFIGTIANGGVSEGRLWGLILWLVNLTTGLGMMFSNVWEPTYVLILLFAVWTILSSAVIYNFAKTTLRPVSMQ